jgi:hypothetical protein
MNERNCIYIKGCPFYNKVILPDIVKDVMIKRYCLDDFEKCERKKIRDTNKKAPDNMTPDGRLIALKD